MISKIRSEILGVILLGKGNKQIDSIHSEKCGIKLTGLALPQWREGNQRKSLLSVSVKINKRFLIAVYQPLQSNGPENKDKNRHDLGNETAKFTMEEILIIRGDHNAHIGRGLNETGATGGFGMRRPTNQAGEDLTFRC